MSDAESEFILAETRLIDLANRANSVATEKAARRVIRDLVEESDRLIPIVGDFEQITDPYSLAASKLTISATMPYKGKPLVKEQIQKRATNLSRSISILEEIRANSS